ncbi:hypothetical protein [Roseomonas marmotae]|uniref:Flagellar protein FlgN n=1 Tax=Roseomonas marmotae TaxID=2768161 RepID=A0ABS3KFC6_9PROT|nr:hypothetical protein [Roseomonas marmotae]MBO1076140.1 hypothetical protein [Roseomonas marmotae]QTI81273.1 hypothetical protein IAI58_18115 [Roseomonas marmotae]
MSALIEAAARLQAVLWRETEVAGSAPLSMLGALMEEKREALLALQRLGPPEGAAERAALRGMMAAAEENGMVLGAVTDALGTVRDRLRSELARAADPGTYGPQGSDFPGPRRRPLRHTLAASLDRSA